MALILTLRKGHDFYAGDQRIVVKEIHSAVCFSVQVPSGEVFRLTDAEWAQALPGVYLQAAIPKKQSMRAVRVAIHAPGLKLLRGEVYRRDRGSPCEACNGSGTLSVSVLHRACSGLGCAICDSGYISESFKCPDCGV